MTERTKNAKRLSAIKIAADLGKFIQKEHPEVAEMYRKLIPLPDIEKKLKLIEEYKVTNHIARNAIEYAIRGYYWGFGIPEYSGLIEDEDELKEIESEYRRKLGNILKKKKIGIFRLSKKEKRKASVMGAEALGMKEWSKEEIIRAYELFQDSNYCYQEGRQKERPKLEIIANVLNSEFHNDERIRTKYSINGLRTKKGLREDLKKI